MQTSKRSLWVLVALVAVIAAVAVVAGSNNKSNKSTSSKTQPAATVSQSKQSQVTGGQYLTDGKGKTLYTSDADKSGVSNCNAECLKTWPVYKADSSTGLPANFSVIKRSDGTMQYAYKNMPLYYFVSDSTPGDIAGNGLNGFHAAKP